MDHSASLFPASTSTSSRDPSPFFLDELNFDMQNEFFARVAKDLLNTFLFSLTSKAYLERFFFVNPRSSGDLIDLSVARGDFRVFEFLLNYFRVDISQYNSQWLYPALRTGHLDFLKEIFRSFPKVPKQLAGMDSESKSALLFTAGSSGSSELVDFLISKIVISNQTRSTQEIYGSIAEGALTAGATDLFEKYQTLSGSPYKVSLKLMATSLLDDTLTSVRYLIATYDPNMVILHKLGRIELRKIAAKGATNSIRFLLSLGPEWAGRFGQTEVLLGALYSSHNRAETLKILLEAGANLESHFLSRDPKNPDLKGLRLMAIALAKTSGEDPNDLLLKTVIKNAETELILDEAFPDLRIRDLETFHRLAEGISNEPLSNGISLGWLVHRSEFLKDPTEIESEIRLVLKKQLWSDKIIPIANGYLCSVGKLDPKSHLPDLLRSGRLRFLTSWIRKGGRIELTSEEASKLYTHLYSNRISFDRAHDLTPKTLRFLVAHGILLPWEPGTDLSAHKCFKGIRRDYLNLGVYKDRPEFSLILAKEAEKEILKFALLHGYSLHPDAVCRALTLSSNGRIRKRFQTEWKDMVTPKAVEGYLAQPQRTPESDRAVMELSGEKFDVENVKHR